jgi:PAS domain S-box-containing protein
MNPYRILIVEDETLVARDLESSLTQVGYAVMGKECTGQAAVRAANELRPDLILMDIQLDGELDGIDAAVEIRRLHGLPVVFLTAFADDVTLARAKAAMPYGYILKPVEDRELRIVIEMSLARSHAEQRLQESERRQRAILDNIPDPVWLKDANGSFLAVNQAWCKCFGLEPSQVLGKTVFELLPPEVAGRFQARDAALMGSGEPLRYDECLPDTRQGERWFDTAKTRVLDAAGRVGGTTGVARDITERKRLEERLRQSSKMEAIGLLAGGMAHEFNNLLGAMMMNLSLLRLTGTQSTSGDPVPELQALCRRAAELIKQLLAFSGHSMMHPQPMDLAAAVSHQCTVLSRLLGERVQLEYSQTQPLPWVNADEIMMNQVLLNLCLNARNAMNGQGVLRLGLHAVEVGIEQAKAQLDARTGPFVCLSVADNGCGMDERVLQHAFEPFFTTRDVGQGTGLGLPVVRGIVRQHGGWVEVDSTVGSGSNFRVYLPAIRAGQPPPNPAQELVSDLHCTILLVEDEPVLRKSACQVLTRLGCRILEAATAEEAIQVWRAHNAEIDVLYTDMIMPGPLTGLQLTEQLLREKPQLKVVISSGYVGDLQQAGGTQEAGVAYLPKPCSLPTLIAVLRSLLTPG